MSSIPHLKTRSPSRRMPSSRSRTRRVASRRALSRRSAVGDCVIEDEIDMKYKTNGVRSLGLTQLKLGKTATHGPSVLLKKIEVALLKAEKHDPKAIRESHTNIKWIDPALIFNHTKKSPRLREIRNKSVTELAQKSNNAIEQNAQNEKLQKYNKNIRTSWPQVPPRAKQQVGGGIVESKIRRLSLQGPKSLSGTLKNDSIAEGIDNTIVVSPRDFYLPAANKIGCAPLPSFFNNKRSGWDASNGPLSTSTIRNRRAIDLNDGKLGSRQICALCATIKAWRHQQLTNLKVGATLHIIRLRGNIIDGVACRALSNSLKGVTSLRELDLSYNPLGIGFITSGLLQVIENSFIHTLNLESCNLGDDGVSALVAILQPTCKTSKTKLVKTAKQNAKRGKQVKGNKKNNLVNRQKKKNKSKVEVNENNSNSHETPKKGIALTLRRLNLRNNNIRAGGYFSLYKVLKNSSGLGALHELYIGGERNSLVQRAAIVVAAGLSENKTIQVIGLSHAGFGRNSKPPVLPKKTTVAIPLKPEKNKKGRGKKGKKKEVTQPKPTFVRKPTIDMYATTPLKALAKSLVANKTLQIVDISFNNIGESYSGSYSELSAAFKVNKTLNTVNLSGNAVIIHNDGTLVSKPEKSLHAMYNNKTSYANIRRKSAGKTEKHLGNNHVGTCKVFATRFSGLPSLPCFESIADEAWHTLPMCFIASEWVPHMFYFIPGISGEYSSKKSTKHLKQEKQNRNKKISSITRRKVTNKSIRTGDSVHNKDHLESNDINVRIWDTSGWQTEVPLSIEKPNDRQALHSVLAGRMQDAAMMVQKYWYRVNIMKHFTRRLNIAVFEEMPLTALGRANLRKKEESKFRQKLSLRVKNKDLTNAGMKAKLRSWNIAKDAEDTARQKRLDAAIAPDEDHALFYMRNHLASKSLKKEEPFPHREEEDPMVVSLKLKYRQALKNGVDIGQIEIDRMKDFYERSCKGINVVRAFSTACSDGNCAVVARMLNNDANPNEVDGTMTSPLMHAILGRKPSVMIVKLLREAGADLNHVNKRGRTALHAAFKIENVEIAAYLIIHGATEYFDLSWRRPSDMHKIFADSVSKLVEKIKTGTFQLQLWMRNQECDNLILNEGKESAIKLTKVKFKCAGIGSLYRVTPAKNKSRSVIGTSAKSKLVQTKRTPFVVSTIVPPQPNQLRYQFKVNHLPIVAADQKSIVTNVPPYPTPLPLPNRKMRKSKTLTKLSPQTDKVTKNRNESDLFLSVGADDIRTCQAMLTKGTNPNCQNNQKQTPIFKACWYGSLDIVCLLVSAGAKIDHFDIKGCSCLHMAFERNQKHVIDYLLRIDGVDALADKPNELGVTPRQLTSLFGKGYDKSLSWFIGARKTVKNGVSLLKKRNDERIKQTEHVMCSKFQGKKAIKGRHLNDRSRISRINFAFAKPWGKRDIFVYAQTLIRQERVRANSMREKESIRRHHLTETKHEVKPEGISLTEVLLGVENDVPEVTTEGISEDTAATRIQSLHRGRMCRRRTFQQLKEHKRVLVSKHKGWLPEDWAIHAAKFNEVEEEIHKIMLSPSRLRSLWSILDSDDSGTCSLNEIKEFFQKKWNLLYIPEAIHCAYLEDTSSHDGRIEELKKQKFCSLLKNIMSFCRIWDALDGADTNGNRNIESRELKVVLSRLGISMDKAVSSAAFRHIYKGGGAKLSELRDWYSMWLAKFTTRKLKKRRRNSYTSDTTRDKKETTALIKAVESEPLDVFKPKLKAHVIATLSMNELQKECENRGLPQMGSMYILKQRLRLFIFNIETSSKSGLSKHKAATKIQSFHRSCSTRRRLTSNIKSSKVSKEKVPLKKYLYDASCRRHYTLLPQMEATDNTKYFSVTTFTVNTARFECAKCLIRFPRVQDFRKHICINEPKKEPRKFPGFFSPEELNGSKQEEWSGWITQRFGSVPYFHQIKGWPIRDVEDHVRTQKSTKLKKKKRNPPKPADSSSVELKKKPKKRNIQTEIPLTATPWWLWRFGQIENDLVDSFHALSRKKPRKVTRSLTTLIECWHEIDPDPSGSDYIGPITVVLPFITKLVRDRYPVLYTSGTRLNSITGPISQAFNATLREAKKPMYAKLIPNEKKEGYIYSQHIGLLLRNLFFYCSIEQMFRMLFPDWRSGTKHIPKTITKQKGEKYKEKKESHLGRAIDKKEVPEVVDRKYHDAAIIIQSIQRGIFVRQGDMTQKSPDFTSIQMKYTDATHCRMTYKLFKDARVMMNMTPGASNKTLDGNDGKALRMFAKIAVEPGKSIRKKFSSTYLEKIAVNGSCSFENFINWLKKTRVW